MNILAGYRQATWSTISDDADSRL